MARRKNALPTFRFHPSTGTYYYWDSAAKKRVRLGRDRDRAEKIFKGIVNRLTSGRPEAQASAPPPLRAAPGQITIAELCLDFRRRVVPDYHDSRARNRLEQAMRRLCDFASEDLADQWTPQRVRDFRRYLLADCVKPDGQVYARKTANYFVAVVKQIWRWAAGEDLIRAETAYKVRLVPPLAKGKGGRETKRVPPVHDVVIDATLPALGPIVAAMVQAQRSTGARPGEVCTMRRREISTRTSEAVPIPETSIEARSDGKVWLYVPGSHKNAHRGKVRVLAIGKRGQQAIGKLVRARDGEPDAAIFSPMEAARWDLEHNGRSTDHLDRAGMIREQYDTYTYGRAISRAIARANRERVAAGSAIVFVDWNRSLCGEPVGSDDDADDDQADSGEGVESPMPGAGCHFGLSGHQPSDFRNSCNASSTRSVTDGFNRCASINSAMRSRSCRSIRTFSVAPLRPDLSVGGLSRFLGRPRFATTNILSLSDSLFAPIEPTLAWFGINFDEKPTLRYFVVDIES